MLDERRQGFDPEEAERIARRKKFIDTRDQYREHAGVDERNIAEVQGAKYETTLHRLMARTEGNPDLINALNGFLDALDNRSSFGWEDQPLGRGPTEALVRFFNEKGNELRYLWGNRPTT